MDRKKFFQGVRDFKKFKHSRVSELSVDLELVSFVFTPESDGQPTNVVIYLQDSPAETRVYVGEKEQVFNKKYLPEIVNSILRDLDGESSLPAASKATLVPPTPAAVEVKVDPPPPAAAAAPDQFFDTDILNRTTSREALKKSTDGREALSTSGDRDLLRTSSSLALQELGNDFGDVTFSEPFGLEGGVEMVDSRGQKFYTCEEFKHDVEQFQQTFGKSAINLTAFGEDVVLLFDLGVDSAIGRDTMMAWGFDSKKRVFARIKTSVHYREGTCPKVTVQEGIISEEKFAPQFQLESIINNYVSATWAHDSKPFDNPLYQSLEDESDRIETPTGWSLFKSKTGPKKIAAPPPRPQPKPKPLVRKTTSTSKKPPVVVSDNLRQLVNMGFNIGQATKALSISDDNLQTAVSLCCECADSLDTSDLDQDLLNRQLSYILNGDDGEEDTADASDSTTATETPAAECNYKTNYLVDLVVYVQSRLPSLNEFCIICDKKHLLGHMLKPTVCTRELCCWSFQELGVAAGATDFVATSHAVVDMLLLFAQEAIKSSRRNIIFDPYPLIFDPADRKRKVFDPDRKDYDKVQRILTRIPTMKSLIESGAKVSEELGKIDPFAHSLLNWVISSNRSFFVKLPSEIQIRGLGDEQFLMLSSPPDKERVFRALRKQHGSVYAFHGSSIENWHSIVRHGLKNASGTKLQVNGTCYGSGIYMSPNLSVAGGYARSCGKAVVALVEVINHGINKATGDIWTVAKEEHVVTRMLLIFNGGNLYGSSVKGDSVASQIRTVMSKYGVSQD